MAFTMRFSDDIDGEELDHLARNVHGTDRTNSLTCSLSKPLGKGLFPGRSEKDTRQLPPHDTILSLAQNEGYVSSGKYELTEEEVAAFEQARELASSGLYKPQGLK